MAAAGDRERARRLAADAEQLTRADPERHAWVPAQAAKAGSPPQASHVLGKAFALGPWPTPLPVLAMFYPQEAMRIVSALYTDDRP